MKKYSVDLRLNRRYIVEVNASSEHDAELQAKQLIDNEDLNFWDWSDSEVTIFDVEEIDYE